MKESVDLRVNSGNYVLTLIPPPSTKGTCANTFFLNIIFLPVNEKTGWSIPNQKFQSHKYFDMALLVEDFTPDFP